MEFKDGEGRTWHPRVSCLALLKVEEYTGVSLFQAAFQQELREKLLSRLTVLLRLMYESVIKEAVKRSVTFEDFCDALQGAELQEAIPVLVEALKEAFPQAKEGAAEGPSEPGAGQTSSDTPR